MQYQFIVKALLVAGGVSMMTQAAQAQRAAPELETLVVTGTRVSSAETLPARVTLLDREALRLRNKANVLDVLRDIEGVQVTQYGGRGGLSSVFLQGAEPNFTVVMIDGVKVNDPNNSRGGSFNFADLNIGEIERIEVIRGPQSSIYGSDALSGVINIVTREAVSDTQLEIALEAGEDDLVRTAVSYAAPLNDATSFFATFSSADEGEVVEGNDYSNTAINLRLRHTGQLSYDLSARWIDAEAEAFPEDSGGPDLAVLRAVDQRDSEQASLAARFSYPLDDAMTLHLLATYLDQEQQQISPGIAPGALSPVPPNRSDAELERANVTAYMKVDVSPDFYFTAGLDHQREDGEQTGEVELFPGFSLPTDFELDREILGVFTEMQYSPSDALVLSASVRSDDPDTDGSETTYRVGGQWRSDSVRAYANWGEAYKLPSFFALGHGLVGNPDLRPETSEGWSVGVDIALGERHEIGLSVFQNEYEDLIDFDFQLFTNVNRSEVETSGFELSTALEFEKMRLSAHLTYVDIDAGDAKLRQRPDWRGGVNLSWSLSDELELGAAWLYVDETFDSSIPTGPADLISYNRLDVHANWAVSENVDVWAAVDNATDTSYQEAIGFPGPGFRARLGVRLRL